MSTAAGCQLEEAFLLKVLRQVVDQHILQKDEVQDDLERHLEALWDLSVEAQAAEIIQQFQGIKIFAQAAERLDFKGHLAEIFLGILANVSTHFRPETETPQSEDFTIAFKALRSSDGLVLVQALRISCSLLCAKMLLSHFWSPAAIDCYIFALEHSLRWDVVRYACDALCQGLLLEMTQDGVFSSMLRGPRLPRLLEERCRELCASDESDSLEEGADVETALWSALRLAESLACLDDAQAEALRSMALIAIDRMEKPEVLVAALEVLSALEEDDDQLAVPCGQAGEVKKIMEKAEVVEKLLLLLTDLGEESSDVVSAAWVLLQHADRAELQKHMEVIEEARASIHQELKNRLSPDFLRFLDSKNATGI